MKYIKWFLAVLLVVPVSAFAFYKPVRVLLPETFGVSCSERNVCVDDPFELDAATALVDDSRRYLEAQWGLTVGIPRLIFCRTEKCQRTFGLAQRAGFTFGTLGIVIAPGGWQRHYVAHELVHYWQAANFGSFVLLRGEPWLIEGMAYALSDDPRQKLHEPFETYRRRFTEWHRQRAGVPLKRSVAEAI